MSKPPQQFGPGHVEIVSQKPLHQGFFQMVEIQFRHPLFAGGRSDTVVREVFERGDAVVVLPYDPVADAVVLIEQLRVPALRTSETPWLLELVAGIIEPDEAREQVARRELMEETGLKAHSLRYLSSFLTSPGGCSERLYLYLAEVRVPDEGEAPGLFGLESEHEDIRRHVVSRQQALEWVAEGHIDNASSIIGLQWLALNHTRLFGRE
ncbi:ADP-ribose diphosphatase [Ferrimonas gelatinilytica]|uniref:ADP-ribose pyrophosphatase n=1 Tax=Ferrimonas gelatinilytica TaxID=1255257 RepID=A0ABP9S8K4_9GAMM